MTMTELARNLRKNLTDAESFLWHHLRCRQVAGFRFRRQAPIECFIPDFVCYELRLIIEVDGAHHYKNEYDQERTKWLSSQGYRVLRFWNNEVLTNIDGVMEVILRACLKLSPHPNLPPQGGKEREILLHLY